MGVFQAQLDNVKENIPVVVAAPEGKALIIKDSVDEMLKKIVMRTYDQSELDKKFAEIIANWAKTKMLQKQTSTKCCPNTKSSPTANSPIGWAN